MDLARIFRDEENGFPITITVMRWSSNFRLLSFIVEILNAEAGRNLEVIQRQGALLLVENGKLLHVELPKEGVDVEAFFETSKVRETLLIATRNEGKTKEFRAIFDKLGYDVENLNDYPDLPEVAETGMTFEENARLKAETISQLTGKMVLADDSGLKSMSSAVCQESGQPVLQVWEQLIVKTMPNSCTNWPWSLNSRTARLNSIQP